MKKNVMSNSFWVAGGGCGICTSVFGIGCTLTSGVEYRVKEITTSQIGENVNPVRFYIFNISRIS
jgi:hypothetical protein